MHLDAVWQTTLIGRQEIWPVHRRIAELGGNLRTSRTRFICRMEKSAAETATLSSFGCDSAGSRRGAPQEARALLHLN